MTATRRWIELASLACLLVTFAVPRSALADEFLVDYGAADSAQPHPLTAVDLETFLDGLVPIQLFRDHIAGAAVVVIKDGEVLLAKGFGHADVQTRQPVMPETLFRLGSISKLFIGIAVMQLVEEGRLDLDCDVNDYLDFPIETPSDGVPVTMRRLLTHRAGFEAQIKGLFTVSGPPQQLGTYLAEHLPPRIFPRGDIVAYSNYGMALAGYIVERVSGEAFDQYLTTHLLSVLGMSHSTFQQPLPDDLQPFMSKGYRDSTQSSQPFEIISAGPAGALSASAADIARFMAALLNGGALDDRRIIGGSTLAEMMTPQVAVPTGLPGMALAFHEHTVEGHRIIGHSGATTLFRSALALIPREHFGVFVSYNSAGISSPQIVSPIIRRYFGRVTPTRASDTSGGADAFAVSGAYQTSLRGEKSFVKIATLLGQLTVRAQKDGKIEIGKSVLSNVGGGVWRDLAALAFDPPDRFTEAAFAVGERGHGAKMRLDSPSVEFIRVSWYEDLRLVLPIIGVSSAVIVCTFALWPFAAVARRRFRQEFGRTVRDRRQFILVRIALIPYLLSLAGAIWLSGRGIADAARMGSGLDVCLMGSYAIAWLAVLESAWIVWVTFRFWRDRVGTLLARIHQSAIAASVSILAWAAVNWHIAGTTLQY